MATTTFRIRKSTAHKGGKIHLTFQYGTQKRFRYSTGLALQNVKNWDKNKMRVKNVLEEKFKTEINNELNSFQAYLEEKFIQLSVTQKIIVTNDMLKEICDRFFNKIKEKEEQEIPNLLDFFDWYIKNYTTKPLPTTGRPLAKGTARTYKNSFNIFKRFSDTQYSITYNDITLKFYDDFLNWMYEQDYSANYIGTQIKVIKTILQSAIDKDFHDNRNFQKKYFRKPVENVDNIYLSQKELLKISKVDVTNFNPIRVNKTLLITPEILKKAKDLFLIGCSTGLRVSDFNRLNSKSLFKGEDGRVYFRIRTKKGDDPVTIPANSIAQTILNNNDGAPPERLPEQHINYAIKILGEIAGIDESTSKTVTKGGQPFTEIRPKYKWISNHTARRSFCTNAYLSGMPTADIMALSGHSTEKVFYNYIKVNDLQRAMKIAEHKFFQ